MLKALSIPSILYLALLLPLGPAFGAGADPGAAISGVAVFVGETPPRQRAIRMDADPNCVPLHEGRVFANTAVVSQDGGIQDVFVYLEDPPAGSFDPKTPTTPVKLAQQGCLYVPRVQGIRVKQILEIVNSDPTLHNVRSLAKTNRPFNVSQPQEGRRTKFFTKPEKPVKFKCDVHSWMTAYLFVMEHPFFATTDANGSFTIEGIPDGTYTFVAWHEEFGEQKFTATIAGGEYNGDNIRIELGR